MPKNVRMFSSQATSPKINKPSGFSPEEITPELAAYVVRSYLLPMFETDVKKQSRKVR
jgi:hypothetical protein